MCGKNQEPIKQANKLVLYGGARNGPCQLLIGVSGECNKGVFRLVHLPPMLQSTIVARPAERWEKGQSKVVVSVASGDCACKNRKRGETIWGKRRPQLDLSDRQVS